MSKRVTKKVQEEDLMRNQIAMQQIRQISEETLSENGRRPTFFIETYGCQMNEHDSEKLYGMLQLMGYTEGTGRMDVDLLIINTCCVRENAELRVYGNLGHLKPLKKTRPGFKIALCGCMMQQPHIVEAIKTKYSQVDLIFGTHNIHEFPTLLLKTFESQTPIIDVWQTEGTVIEGVPTQRRYGIKGFVDIMYGCDNFCTYCIVPYTRGRERSRTPEAIIAEINDLVRDGVREVTLLGQNVNSYGQGLSCATDFPDLLMQVDAIEGLERIRFMTNHPKDVPDKLIGVMADSRKICKQFHLPLQAGSDGLLKAMNRNYTVEQYLRTIAKLRAAMPDITLTTDIIVGFPGETEADVERLIAVAREIRFDSAYTFIYSQRTGTPAAKLDAQIPEEIKHVRFEKVLKVFNEIVIEKNKDMAGKTVTVLVEGVSKKNEKGLTGRDDGNRIVNFPGSDSDIGQMVRVRITKPKSFSLMGEKI